MVQAPRSHAGVSSDAEQAPLHFSQRPAAAMAAVDRSNRIGMAARLGAAAVTRSTAAARGRNDGGVGRSSDRRGGPRWLLEPAMQGIYASPASELSAARDLRRPQARSAPARGARRRHGSVHHASARAAARSRRALSIQHRASIDSTPDVPTVIATPAPAAARLVAPHAPRSGRRASRRSAWRRWSRSRCFSSRIPRTCAASACCFHGSRRAARSACSSTPTFSRAAARGDRKPGSSAIASTRMTTWDDDRLRADAGRRSPPPHRSATTSRSSLHITRWPAAIPVYDAAIRTVANGAGVPAAVAGAGWQLPRADRRGRTARHAAGRGATASRS